MGDVTQGLKARPRPLSGAQHGSSRGAKDAAEHTDGAPKGGDAFSEMLAPRQERRVSTQTARAGHGKPIR
eukprot:9826986-Lingulodinium_polyedra.AAC.1